MYNIDNENFANDTTDAVYYKSLDQVAGSLNI